MEVIKKCWQHDAHMRPSSFAEIVDMLVYRTSNVSLLPQKKRSGNNESKSTGITPNVPKRRMSNPQLYYNDPALLKELAQLRDRVADLEEEKEIEDFRSLIGGAG